MKIWILVMSLVNTDAPIVELEVYHSEAECQYGLRMTAENATESGLHLDCVQWYIETN
jgi:hypothetical protein